MIDMFHVERLRKNLFKKGFFVLMIIFLTVSCITPRHTVEINDYVLIENGKEVLGKEKGLTAFVFENNQKKMPFSQFLVKKYNLGYTEELDYYIILEGHRFRIFLYENAELEKYFDMSQFMVTKFETEVNRVGSSANFIGLSVIDDFNEDCLSDGSLYQNLILKYLKDLKFEYNN